MDINNPTIKVVSLNGLPYMGFQVQNLEYVAGFPILGQIIQMLQK